MLDRNNEVVSKLLNRTLIQILLVSIPILSYLVFVANYAVNLPSWDDYDSILSTLLRIDSAENVADKLLVAVSQHNEHRVFFLRLFAYLDFNFFGELNFKRLILLGAIIVVVNGFLLIKMAESSLRLLLLVSAPFYFAFSYHVLTFWATTTTTLPLVILFFLLALLVVQSRMHPILKGFVCALIASASLYSNGNGLLSFIILLYYLIINKEKISTWIVFLFSSVPAILYYFMDYRRNPGHPDPIASFVEDPVRFVSYLFSLLGNPFHWITGNSSTVVSGLFGLLLVVLLYLVIKPRFFRPEKDPLFYVFLFVLGSGLLTALSRSGFGTEQSLSSRYIYNTILLWILAIYFIYKDWTALHRPITIPALLLIFAGYWLYSIYHFLPKIRYDKANLTSKLYCGDLSGECYYYPNRNRAHGLILQSQRKGIYTLPIKHETGSVAVSNTIKHDPLLLNNSQLIDEDSIYRIRDGWFFKQHHREPIAQKFVLLVSKSDTIKRVVPNLNRPDVTKAYPDGINYDYSGYNFKISKSKLEPDELYQLYVGLTDEENRTFYANTNKILFGLNISYDSTELARVTTLSGKLNSVLDRDNLFLADLKIDLLNRSILGLKKQYVLYSDQKEIRIDMEQIGNVNELTKSPSKEVVLKVYQLKRGLKAGIYKTRIDFVLDGKVLHSFPIDKIYELE